MANIFKKMTEKNNTKVASIVEVSGNHQNSYKKLENLIYDISKMGADIVKFQVYKPETITIKSNKKDFLGCIRRNGYVTVVIKQTSNTIPGDFLGRLVLGVEGDLVKVFGATIF